MVPTDDNMRAVPVIQSPRRPAGAAGALVVRPAPDAAGRGGVDSKSRGDTSRPASDGPSKLKLT